MTKLPGPPTDVASLIERADAGDKIARDALFAALYDELHRVAHREVRRLGQHSPLGATTLLHEVYLAFGTRAGPEFPDESRFLAYAARAMRGVVIDRVRATQAAKRGGGALMITLDAQHAEDVGDADELMAVHEALEILESVDEQLARVVDLRFFCGFTFAEIAQTHGVAERTVQRQWEKARLFLRHSLNPVASPSVELP